MARGQKVGRREFAASFYAGDCRSAEVFNKLAQDGCTEQLAITLVDCAKEQSSI